MSRSLPARRMALWLVSVTLCPVWAQVPAPSAASAPVENTRVIAYCNEDNPRIRAALLRIGEHLKASGVTQRHNIRIEHVYVDAANADATRATLRALVQRRPAVIIAPNGPTATIAKSVTTDIPIVFGSHEDPLELGLVTSLARPGHNLTGLTFFVPIEQKRIELLRDALPKARKLGVLVDRWWSQNEYQRRSLEQASKRFGFGVELFRADTIVELQRQLATPRAASVDAWYLPLTILLFSEPATFLQAMAATRKPALYPRTLDVAGGGMLSYQQQLPIDEALQRMANLTGLILDGVKPGDIPVERPREFELAVNVTAARSLGIELPKTLLRRADKTF